MNSGVNLHNEVPKYVWVILITAVLMLFSAVWWASAQGRHIDCDKIGVGDNPPARPAPMNLNNQAPQVASSIPPPSTAPDFPVPKTSVTITPVKHAPHFGTSRHDFKLTRRLASRNQSGLGDMFPFGKILPRTVKDSPPATAEPQPSKTPPPDTRPRIIETFPGFEYGGAKWSFTGAYADGRQLQLSSEYTKLAGRSVCGLADVTGKISLLFVQSALDPNRWAIYRQGD